MTDARDADNSSNATLEPEGSSKETGTLVSWTAGIGDTAKSHVVHVDPTGMAWALNLKKPEVFGQLVGETTARPAEAAAVIAKHPGSHRLPGDQLARVSYTEQLNELTVVEKAGKKHNIADGSGGEQAKIFEAVRRDLGGAFREEDADVWSVIKGFLLPLVVTVVIGGFFIWFTTISDPNADISGRRAGMKKLLNWLGYTIGPVWSSIIVGTITLLIVSMMAYLLVKRPKRQVLEF